MADKTIKSVQKALKILDILTLEDPGRKGIKLTNLAERIGIPVNTLHTLLKTMIAYEYVIQNDNSSYATGPKIDQITLVSQIRNWDFPSVLPEILCGLRDEIQENVLFYILINGHRVCAAQYLYEGMVRVHLPAYTDDNIYTKPTGRLLIAYCNKSQLNDVITEWGLPYKNWDNIDTREKLEIRLEELRHKGYDTNYTESEGVKGYGYPVLDLDGRLVGAIAVYAPKFRCEGKKDTFILTKMKEAAVAISKNLKISSKNIKL